MHSALDRTESGADKRNMLTRSNSMSRRTNAFPVSMPMAGWVGWSPIVLVKANSQSGDSSDAIIMTSRSASLRSAQVTTG